MLLLYEQFDAVMQVHFCFIQRDWQRQVHYRFENVPRIVAVEAFNTILDLPLENIHNDRPVILKVILPGDLRLVLDGR